jgi:hypothetical protein
VKHKIKLDFFRKKDDIGTGPLSPFLYFWFLQMNYSRKFVYFIKSVYLCAVISKTVIMKKFFCFILLFVCINCLAQDEVVFHNGNIAKGKVTEVTDLYIKFSYDGEDLVNTIGRCAISEVRFQSGRVQQMSQKVDVKSPDDWENVRLVYDKNEVLGLKSLGQIEKHSSGTWSFSITAGHFSEKTMKKIRKEAAKRGGCIVLIFSQQSNSGGFFKDGHASMSGEIYTY